MLNKQSVFSDKKNWLKTLLSTIFNIVLVLFAACVIMIVIFTSSHIQADVKYQSMHPTVEDGAVVYAKSDGNYTYNSIVLAITPDSAEKKVIKRVVALGGDKIGFYFNQTLGEIQTLLIKNGEENICILNEDYLPKTTKQSKEVLTSFLSHNSPLIDVDYNGENVKMLELNQNQVFVLGDNRAYSNDSSEYGPISTENIFASVELVVNNPNTAYFAIIKHILGF